MRIDAVDAEWARPGINEQTRVYFEIGDYGGMPHPECSVLDPGMLDHTETVYAVPVPHAYFRLTSEPMIHIGRIPGFPQEIVADVVRGFKC